MLKLTERSIFYDTTIVKFIEFGSCASTFLYHEHNFCETLSWSYDKREFLKWGQKTLLSVTETLLSVTETLLGAAEGSIKCYQSSIKCHELLY